MKTNPNDGSGYRAQGGYIGGYVAPANSPWRGRLLRRDDPDPAKQQCPADGVTCGQRLNPTMYAYDDKKPKGVWVLGPLSDSTYDAFQKEAEADKLSQIDLFKKYKATWLDDASTDPGLKAVKDKKAS